MSSFSRFLPRAGVTAAVALATTIAIAAPADAATRHDTWWDDADASAWGGAGAGWNGSSWNTGGNSWTPADAAAVEVRDLRVDRAAISPNDDGEGDEAFVTFRLRRASAPVRVEVIDASGAVIRTLGEQRTTRTDASFGWDGTSDAGAIVADGAYRIRLTKLAAAAGAGATTTTPTTATTTTDESLALDVVVDTTAPSVTANRPTLTQLQVLAKRAGKLRDQRRRWAQYQQRRHGARHRGPGSGGWSDRDRDWMRAYESMQLRLPVTFTTVEDGDVTITATVAGRSNTMTTWRAAGRSTVNVVLPTYQSGAKLELTFAAQDDAGNEHRHTVVAALPAMPAPAPTRRSNENYGGGSGGGGNSGSGGSGGTTPPATGIPTSGGGPLPDWLDPIMLRATYGAGVPQSWAKSQALANLIQHESSFRATAQNPTSTAYGLFQFLNTTWATVGCTKTSDAYQQSVCGLRYIQRRYHTPEAAWRFWQAQSPHWY